MTLYSEDRPYSSSPKAQPKVPALTMAERKAAARAKPGFTFLYASVVLDDVAVRTVALDLPRGQQGAGHPLGALAAPAVVRLGQAEQAAGLGDAGVLPWHKEGDRVLEALQEAQFHPSPHVLVSNPC